MAMSLLLEGRRVLFVLLLVMSPVESEADHRNTCEAKHQFTEGLIAYSELLLGSIKKEMKRLMEECNVTKISGTIITKELDDSLNANENIEKEIRGIAEEKANLKREIDRLQLLRAMQVKDQCTIKKSLEIALDCGDIQLKGARKSGLYDIKPNKTGDHVRVFCDLETTGGGWTVFLNHDNQTEPIDFNRSWSDYKEGFGDKNSEFWLGNDFLHILTSGDDPVTLRVEAEDLDGERRWGEWKVFKVDSEEHKYQLTVEKYRTKSTLGDSLAENNKCHFSTWDQDNDNFSAYQCAQANSGTGGWWYNNCGHTRPTGKLGTIKEETIYKTFLVYWGNWTLKGSSEKRLLQRISMKLRRRRYKLPSLLNMRNLC